MDIDWTNEARKALGVDAMRNSLSTGNREDARVASRFVAQVAAAMAWAYERGRADGFEEGAAAYGGD